MRIELEKRPNVSKLFSIFSRRSLRLSLTMIFGGIMFALLGKDPVEALYSFLHRAADGSLVAARTGDQGRRR